MFLHYFVFCSLSCKLRLITWEACHFLSWYPLYGMSHLPQLEGGWSGDRPGCSGSPRGVWSAAPSCWDWAPGCFKRLGRDFVATFLHGWFLFQSKGWNVVSKALDRKSYSFISLFLLILLFTPYTFVLEGVWVEIRISLISLSTICSWPLQVASTNIDLIMYIWCDNWNIVVIVIG